MKTHTLILAALLPLTGFAQVNSGSDGHDGALNPATSVVIDMADHPPCHVERQRNISDYFPLPRAFREENDQRFFALLRMTVVVASPPSLPNL